MNRRRFLSWCAAIPAFFGVGAKADLTEESVVAALPKTRWRGVTRYGPMLIDKRFMDNNPPGTPFKGFLVIDPPADIERLTKKT